VILHVFVDQEDEGGALQSKSTSLLKVFPVLENACVWPEVLHVLLGVVHMGPGAAHHHRGSDLYWQSCFCGRYSFV